jgi:imidazolonepropionase-like amidohydrolase
MPLRPGALRVRPLALAVISALAAARVAPAQAPERSAADAPLVVTPVTVVDVVRGVRLPGRTVVVRAGRIAHVGAAGAVAVPAGARVVDGRGGFLIPGLWDMHVHAARDGRARHFWPLLLAHGVTGVREMGSYLDSLVYWRAEARRRPAEAPRVAWSSPMLDGVPTSWVHGYGVADAAAARTAVDTMRTLGFDALKVYSRLSRDAYLAIAERARERRIPFAGHVPASVTAREASDAGQRSLEHVQAVALDCMPSAVARRAEAQALALRLGPTADSTRAARARFEAALLAGPDEAACTALFRRLAANGTWLTPTLAVTWGRTWGDSVAADPRLAAVPPALAARWDSARRASSPRDVAFARRMQPHERRIVALAHAAGVGLLAGTDASDEDYVFAGSGLHDELAHLVAAGLPPLAALRAATLAPARYLGAADSLGSVEAGKVADLVLLDADPLVDIANTRRIRAVIARGRLVDAAERERLLRLAAAEAARTGVAPPARR